MNAHDHDIACECSTICDPPSMSCDMLGGHGCACQCVGIAIGRAAERERILQEMADQRWYTKDDF